MFNKCVDVYRHTRQSSTDKYKTEAEYTGIDIQIEPAARDLVAPIDTTIGRSFNVYLETYQDLTLKNGDKLVTQLDTTEYYIIISAIQNFQDGDINHYEFVVEQPSD